MSLIGLIVALIVISLAIQAFMGLARRVGPTLNLAFRELERGSEMVLSIVRLILSKIWQVTRQLIKVVVLPVKVASYCFRKALSPFRKSPTSKRTEQTAPLHEVTHTLAARPVSNDRKPSRWRALAASPIQPVCVVALFALISGALGSRPDSFLKAMRDPKSATDVATIPTKPDEMPSPANAIPLSEAELKSLRPNWISDGDFTSGDIQYVVLSSQLWSTVQEAHKALADNATQILHADFQRRHKSPFVPANGALNQSRLIDAAVKEQHLELVQQSFGKYSAPMYRLWWRLEISPIVRTELFPDWKAATTRNKIMALGVLLAGLTFVANLMSALSLPGSPRKSANDRPVPHFANLSLN